MHRVTCADSIETKRAQHAALSVAIEDAASPPQADRM